MGWTAPEGERPKPIISFIFDGGVLADPGGIRLQEEELDDWRFTDPAEFGDYLPPFLVPRVRGRADRPLHGRPGVRRRSRSPSPGSAGPAGAPAPCPGPVPAFRQAPGRIASGYVSVRGLSYEFPPCLSQPRRSRQHAGSARGGTRLAADSPWRVTWSVPAAMRAVRATIVVPGLFALTFKVIGDRR